MNKQIGIGILALLLLAGQAFAGDEAYVFGNIYLGETSEKVLGAEITITCAANGQTVSTTSLSDSGWEGFYDTYGIDFQCPESSEVTVTAEKDGMKGTNTGTVTYDGELWFVNVSVVDVPIFAPELVGALAAIAVLVPGAAYLKARKRK